MRLAMLAETLPLPQRLALTYARRDTRASTLALLALEQRLAAILRSGGEPTLAQIKLAWWRERLGEGPAKWPDGEPLLALLRDFPGGTAQLRPVVDGWEVLARLREHPATYGVPIVVCTILAQEDLAMLLGAADFVRKPINQQSLLSALDRQLDPPPRGRP